MKTCIASLSWFVGVWTIIAGERVANMQEVRDKGFSDVTVYTDKGQAVKADLAIPCTGLKVNSLAYESSFRELPCLVVHLASNYLSRHQSFVKHN